MNSPTPARPALDEGDEPSPEAILIAAWKLRFDKAFRPEEEAGALMAFLDTIGLCVVSKRSLADMRGALERAKDHLYNPFEPDNQSNAYKAVVVALARSAP